MFKWFGDRVKAYVGQQIDSRMDQMGKRFVAAARGYAPVRTGQLRDSIGYTYDQSRKVMQFHADMSYSWFVEAGTRFMRAQPYMRPAINDAVKVWGGNVEIQFPNTPHLQGTNRKSTPSVVKHNRAQMLRFRGTKAGKAKVINRRGKWNGPPGGWSHSWNQIPGARPRSE